MGGAPPPPPPPPMGAPPTRNAPPPTSPGNAAPASHGDGTASKKAEEGPHARKSAEVGEPPSEKVRPKKTLRLRRHVQGGHAGRARPQDRQGPRRHVVQKVQGRQTSVLG